MEIIAAVKLWFMWLWSQWQTQVLVFHILINVVVALAASIYAKEFIMAKIPEFLYRKILPYTMIYAVFAFAGDAIGQGAVATSVWGLITAALLADLFDNLKRFGLDFIPRSMTTEQADEAAAYIAGERYAGERTGRRYARRNAGADYCSPDPK